MDNWLLVDRGRHLVVETWPEDDRTRARLLVDGEERASGDGSALDSVKLAHDDLHVLVRLLWKGRVRSVDLVDHGDDGPPGDGDPFRTGRLGGGHLVPFEPPAGTAAARRHEWREAHPTLWAARHMVLEAGAIVVAVLGIGALLSALLGELPRFDVGWLPDVGLPEWVKYLNPLYWLGQLLPELDWFGWLPDIEVPGWMRHAGILLVAALVGARELRQRRQRQRREERSSESGSDDPPVSP